MNTGPTNNRRSLWLPVVMAALLVSGCGILTAQPVQPSDPNAIFTQAAQTVIAQLTQIGPQGTPQPATDLPSWPPPEITSTTAPTQAPTSTQTDPTPTRPPATPTTESALCDAAEFVRDVTVADGSFFSPGETFTKVWRLKNVGTCTWISGYDLAFLRGDGMNAPAVVPLKANVRPGETVDLAVELVAPPRAGRYRGDWMLRNASGVMFGLGTMANKAFWVEIIVSTPSAGVYNFTTEFCNADWRSDAGSLPCPGPQSEPSGFVMRLDAPNLEYGRENEAGLVTHPPIQENGAISGHFPGIEVEDGDRFQTVTACVDGKAACNVMFQLNYRVGDGPIRNLKTWTETYDGRPTRIDIDLSELSGRRVEFILTVLANGSAEGDEAFWLQPTVWRSDFSDHGSDGARAARIAREFLARQLGIDPAAISVVSYESAEWTDSCLNVSLPDRVCVPAVTPGFRVLLRIDGRIYEAHTDRPANYVYWFTR